VQLVLSRRVANGSTVFCTHTSSYAGTHSNTHESADHPGTDCFAQLCADDVTDGRTDGVALDRANPSPFICSNRDSDCSSVACTHNIHHNHSNHHHNHDNDNVNHHHDLVYHLFHRNVRHQHHHGMHR